MTVHDCDSDAHALVDEGTCAAPVFYTPLPLDPDDYLPYLDGFDMSLEQKQAALFALWHIMSAIVDIGFGMDTVQILLPDIFEKASRDSGKLLERYEPDNSGKQTT